MIWADKKDYKNAFRKHYSTYLGMEAEHTAVISQNMILAYAVECGLKYLLLDKWKVSSPQNSIKNNEDGRYRVLITHDIMAILKELGKTNFRFPVFCTCHKDEVHTKDFHEVCRYVIYVSGKDEKKNKEYVLELIKVLGWIQEEIA